MNSQSASPASGRRASVPSFQAKTKIKRPRAGQPRTSRPRTHSNHQGVGPGTDTAGRLATDARCPPASHYAFTSWQVGGRRRRPLSDLPPEREPILAGAPENDAGVAGVV